MAKKHLRDGDIEFLIKESGDYTSTLGQTLNPNQPVKLEGPYGYFNFSDSYSHQLWIAGGIGITPFLSALQYVPPNRKVDLIYTLKESDQSILDSLTRQSRAENIRLHLINKEQFCSWHQKNFRGLTTW